MYGPSDACGFRCTGDLLSTCGGYDAMDIFALDGENREPQSEEERRAPR